MRLSVAITCRRRTWRRKSKVRRKICKMRRLYWGKERRPAMWTSTRRHSRGRKLIKMTPSMRPWVPSYPKQSKVDLSSTLSTWVRLLFSGFQLFHSPSKPNSIHRPMITKSLRKRSKRSWSWQAGSTSTEKKSCYTMQTHGTSYNNFKETSSCHKATRAVPARQRER